MTFNLGQEDVDCILNAITTANITVGPFQPTGTGRDVVNQALNHDILWRVEFESALALCGLTTNPNIPPLGSASGDVIQAVINFSRGPVTVRLPNGNTATVMLYGVQDPSTADKDEIKGIVCA